MIGNLNTVSLEAFQEHLILFPSLDGPALYNGITVMFRTADRRLINQREAPASMLAALALFVAGIGATLVPGAVARNVSMTGYPT